MWVWQQSDRPAFRYAQDQLNPLLREVHFLQRPLLGRIGGQGETQCQQATLDTLLANILNSSAIEGEQLNHSSVQSSLARKLGLLEAELAATSSKTYGVANMLMKQWGWVLLFISLFWIDLFDALRPFSFLNHCNEINEQFCSRGLNLTPQVGQQA